MAAKHRDAVYRQMLRMCGNHDDAEDVLVDALVKAYLALPSLKDDEAFRVWLAQIARRSCGRLKRRAGLRPLFAAAGLDLETAELASPDPTPEEQVLLDETHGCVMRAVGSLPPLYRDVYRLRELDGLPAEVVADRLDLTVAAVKSRLHRARTIVRAALDEDFGCDGA